MPKWKGKVAMSNKLMLGLWRYIVKVPPFIWQKQIAAGKVKFEKEYGILSEEYRIKEDSIIDSF
jgi:hypothetical protein